MYIFIDQLLKQLNRQIRVLIPATCGNRDRCQQYFMKNSALLIIIFLISNLTFANRIDRLKTTEDVVSFVKKVSPELTKSKWVELKIPSTNNISKEFNCNGIFNFWEIKNWEKTDLNNDGKTDLLFIADYYQIDTYAIIDNGFFDYSTYLLSTNTYEPCQLFKPIKVKNENFLKIYTAKTKSVSLTEFEKTTIIDTLTFKYDQFVEVNKNPADYSIKLIEYNSALFSIKIKSDGTTYYNGHREAAVEETRKIKISSKKFRKLENLFNYIRVKELKNEYEIAELHGTNAYLKITFEDNFIKEIKDYGSIGTYGLRGIYENLENIVKNEIWN
jgi:hypothetical protein